MVKPEGFITVSPGDEEGFLRHQDIVILPGIGAKISERLKLLGIHELGELARLPDDALSAALGARGAALREAARGLDFTPVTPGTGETKKIRHEVLLESDTNEKEELMARLFTLVEETGCRLRRDGMTATRVEISLTYTDGIRAAGASRLAEASWCDRDFFEAARDLFDRLRQRRVRVRRISLTLSGLQGGNLQLDLFAPPEKIKRQSLQRALDSIRGRYGDTAIRSGYTLRQATHG